MKCIYNNDILSDIQFSRASTSSSMQKHTRDEVRSRTAIITTGKISVTKEFKKKTEKEENAIYVSSLIPGGNWNKRRERNDAAAQRATTASYLSLD